MTGRQNLGTGTNRLDALVLGLQLLQVGAKATVVVNPAKEVQLENPLLAQKGYSKWELVLIVKAQDTTPVNYANLTISLSTAEKAAKIAYEGAEVPLSYDPLNLQTVSIDSMRWGIPTPIKHLLKLLLIRWEMAD